MTEPVDFHHVPERQREIDAKLVNWARWCEPGRANWGIQPMFRGYRPYLYPEIPASTPIDVVQAVGVQKTMAHVPPSNRHALHWFYIYRDNPSKIARNLAVSRDGLLQLVTDGRDMVKNRLTVDKPMCILTSNVSIFA